MVVVSIVAEVVASGFTALITMTDNPVTNIEGSNVFAKNCIIVTLSLLKFYKVYIFIFFHIISRVMNK